MYILLVFTGVHVRSLVWENGHWLVLDGTGALYKVDLPEVRYARTHTHSTLFLHCITPLKDLPHSSLLKMPTLTCVHLPHSVITLSSSNPQSESAIY